MKRLPEKITRGDFTFKLMKRTKHVAMYAQWVYVLHLNRQYFLAYEVFEIKRQKERTSIMGGVEVHFEAKENYPHDESFGTSAFAITDLDRAEDKFEELSRKVHERRTAIMN